MSLSAIRVVFAPQQIGKFGALQVSSIKLKI